MTGPLGTDQPTDFDVHADQALAIANTRPTPRRPRISKNEALRRQSLNNYLAGIDPLSAPYGIFMAFIIMCAFLALAYVLDFGYERWIGR